MTTTEAYRKPGLGAKLSDLAASVGDQARAALREAMTWSLYRWTVLALLTATFILVALSYGGIRAELAALKQERSAAGAGGELERRIAEMNAALTKSIGDLKADLDASLAKIGARPEAKTPAPAPTPAPPVPKPRPRTP